MTHAEHHEQAALFAWAALAIAQTPSEDEGTRRGIGGAGEALGRILGALEAKTIKPAA